MDRGALIRTAAGAPDVAVTVKAVTTDGSVTLAGTIHLWVVPKKG